jgi:hypothetical protein
VSTIARRLFTNAIREHIFCSVTWLATFVEKSHEAEDKAEATLTMDPRFAFQHDSVAGSL